MTYIEKVLKGLECCAECERCAGNCPYDDDDDNCEKCTSELAKGALSVIREQQEEIQRLKRKSRWIVNTKKYGEDNYHCLLCGAIVEKDEAGRHYWQRCYHCGAYMELMDGTDRDYDKDGEHEC